MVTVDYEYEFDFLSNPSDGSPYPGLEFRLENPQTGEAIETRFHVDSGAEATLVDGRIGRAIGLDLLVGQDRGFVATNGASLMAKLHRVRLSSVELGDFELDVAFSLESIQRSLLGRDFFALVQLGFRERYSKLFVGREAVG